MNEVERFCIKHEPCIDGAKWAKQYTTFADVYDNCQRGDWLMWMLNKANKIKPEQARLLAIEFAERVLPIWEAKHPNDDRPRKAIDAAKNSSNHIISAAYSAYSAYTADVAARAATAAAARAAAYAAYTAASAADAVAYANDAVYAADASTYTAAYSAYAAEYSALAANDTSSEQKWQADRIREVIQNPWRKA